MDIITEKNRIKNFYYSHKYTELVEDIGAIGKLSEEQLDSVDHYLTSLLWGDISPTEFTHALEGDCLLSEQQYTIVLTLIHQKLLDPLKEIFDAIYNPQPTSKTVTGTQPIAKASKEDGAVKPNFHAAEIATQVSANEGKNFDPLDMFDRAKNDIRTTSQENNQSVQGENATPVPSVENQNATITKKIGAQKLPSEPIKETVPLNSNPIKINQAAVLGDEENSNLLILQNNQAISQLSQVLKNNTPIVEKGDLNLYIPDTQPKEEAPKPLNPSALQFQEDDDIPETEQEELTASLDRISTPNSGIMAVINVQAAEPKETTIKENIAQSRLKFIQDNKQKIPEDANYSRLLNAMAPKTKNQPPVVGTLKNTFAHPDRYSESYEVAKPKPKKYATVKDDAVRSSIISSTESSSNIKSNAIMEKTVENDIINLAKDISQERGTTNTKNLDVSHQPIVYNKRPKLQEDPFENINKNKQSEKERNKSSHVIDLS